MTDARRPIQARSFRPIQQVAVWLATTRATPNQISVASVLFACMAAAALLANHSWGGYLIAATGIQLRLLCNVLDGLVAVEGGKKSVLGALYNEFPDRVADTLIIVAAGYAVGVGGLGWAGALAAALTAYIRVSGGALGFPQDFRGPMAKQHRMAVITIGCLSSAIESQLAGTHHALMVALVVVVAGSVATCWTRTAHIAAQLQGSQLE